MIAPIQNPVQVDLREDQLQVLDALVQETGTSLTDLIRRGVDTLIRELPATDRTDVDTDDPTVDEADSIGQMIGMIDSGVSDLSINHDRYLVELLEQESRTWQPKSS
ncbi:MAG: hypothetical protein M3Z04_05590 [Chloroflexota bacterium]|nr:hypothetical protein [Chloroflexota bacterium]